MSNGEVVPAYATEPTTCGTFYYQKTGVSGSAINGFAPEATISANRSPYFVQSVVGGQLVVAPIDSYATEATRYANRRNSDPGTYYVPASGTAPAITAPGAPFATTIGSTSIVASFFTTDANAGNTFEIEYGLGQTDLTPVSATQVNSALGIYQGTLTGLEVNTPYYLRSSVTDANGNKLVSAVIGPITTADDDVPPSKAPTVPTPILALSTSMSVSFSADGISGSEPITYGILYGTTTTPLTTASATVVPGTSTYTVALTGLTPGTAYYFKSQALGIAGTTTSAVSPAYTTPAVTPSVTPPSSAPTVPVVSGSPTTTSITVNFDVAGITGTPTPVYSIFWGTVANPTTSAPATLVSGTTYQAVVSGLTAGTNYFFSSVASNVGGTKTSAISGPISTASGGQAPANPPDVPVVVGTPTTTSITVAIGVAKVGGLPQPTISALYGTVSVANIPITATLQPDGSYHATATALTPATAYYFVSVASNSFGTLKSNISASITTATPPPATTAPSSAPTVPAISGNINASTITMTFDTAGITGTSPILFSFLWGTTSTPTKFQGASVISGTVYGFTFTGLTAGTQYYFQSVASNEAGAVKSANGTATTASSGVPPQGINPPVITGSTSTQIQVTMDANGITGIPYPTFSIAYGTSISNLNQSFPMTFKAGTIYEAIVPNLTPATTYYLTSVATNTAGVLKWLNPQNANTQASPTPSIIAPLAPYLGTLQAGGITYMFADFTPCLPFPAGTQPTIAVGATSTFQGQYVQLQNFPAKGANIWGYNIPPPYATPPGTKFFANAFLYPAGTQSPVVTLTS